MALFVSQDRVQSIAQGRMTRSRDFTTQQMTALAGSSPACREGTLGSRKAGAKPDRPNWLHL